MALVYRNGRAYSYKTSREGGRVVCRYQGSGEIALLIEQFEALDRFEREAQALDDVSERDASEAAERPLADYCKLVDDLARAALLASGCHQHKRQWRRRRVESQEP